MRKLFGALVLMPLMSAAVSAQDFPDITAISLEDLMNMRVTSVSKRETKLANAPAAISVITQEEIRRSGARNIPEALRLAPGLEVARIDENKWAIASRGFNGRFTNKLLVLIDGRSVYTPLFSGVYWNVQDVLLEDVDRIEVIRGPGATLWGANAVNGVINIITKEARATQGGQTVVQYGDELQGAGGFRYGGKIGENTYYRAYTKYFKWDSSTDEAGQPVYDGWDATRGGFRIDGAPSSVNSFTVQGDIYGGDYGETLTGALLTAPYSTTFRNDGEFSGGNLLGRWNHSFTASKTSLQVYFDRASSEANSLLDDNLSIFDVDFQHDIRINANHEWIWGLGYRLTHDSAEAGTYVTLTPDVRTWSLFSAFVQDEFALFNQRLRVTVGAKLEHNEFTKFETEPNGRVLWTINPKQSVWGAISRAVRTPARTEQDMTLNAAVLPPSDASFGLPVLVTVQGDRQFESEDVVAYEGGYRLHPGRTLSVDIAAFYNSYNDLLSAEPTTPFLDVTSPDIHAVAPLIASNKFGGATYGTELFAEWRPSPILTVNAAYTYLRMDVTADADSLDVVTKDPAGASPRHQFYAQSFLNLPKNFEGDMTYRFVDSLDELAVGSYYSLDGRIGWNVTPRLELSFGVQNLTNNEHLEFRPDFIATTPTLVKRSFQTVLRWKF